jgi:RNA polymerase subunit RPABC4/transcription elongation factor Spt4
MKKLKQTCSYVWEMLKKLWSNAKKFINPDEETCPTCPRSDTALLSLLGLLVFLGTAVIAIIYPTTTVKQFVIASNASIAIALSGTFVLDLATSMY